MKKWSFRSRNAAAEHSDIEPDSAAPESDSTAIESDCSATESDSAHDHTASEHVDKTTNSTSETEKLNAATKTDEPGDPEESAHDGSRATDEPNGGTTTRRRRAVGALAYSVLPAAVLLMAVGAGILKWQVVSARDAEKAGTESVAAAKDSTVALLSYKPESVEQDLGAARERLAGQFKQSYTQLIQDVVIPGAKQKHISAAARIPAASSVSATPSHAVALLYVDQTTIVGNDTPTDTQSSVRVSMEKVSGRWLITAFDPI